MNDFSASVTGRWVSELLSEKHRMLLSHNDGDWQSGRGRQARERSDDRYLLAADQDEGSLDCHNNQDLLRLKTDPSPAKIPNAILSLREQTVPSALRLLDRSTGVCNGKVCKGAGPYGYRGKCAFCWVLVGVGGNVWRREGFEPAIELFEPITVFVPVIYRAKHQEHDQVECPPSVHPRKTSQRRYRARFLGLRSGCRSNSDRPQQERRVYSHLFSI